MTISRPAIPPQIGKRHVMRNGELTGVVMTTKNYQWPFSDGRRIWTAYGRFSNHIISKYDIIAVHEEPEAEPVQPAAAISLPQGMTVHDWYAGLAMQALINAPDEMLRALKVEKMDAAKVIALAANNIADAMEAARERKGPTYQGLPLDELARSENYHTGDDA